MKMTKLEYMQENKYIRKWLKNLNQEDLDFLKAVSESKINPYSDIYHLRFKQVVFHMTKWMTLREMRWLLKAFKTLKDL